MEDFIWIALLIAYLIIQVLGAKKKKKKKNQSVSGTTTALPDAAGRPASAPGAEPTLDDTLREIRLALGMEAPAKPAAPPLQAAPPMPPPAPRLPAKTRPVRSHAPELAETAPKKSWSSEFRAYPTHYADSDFEELRGEGDRFGKSPKQQKQKEPRRPAAKTATARKSLVEPTKPTSAGVSRAMVMKQLKSPNAAREAFILSEILGPPRAQKRR